MSGKESINPVVILGFNQTLRRMLKEQGARLQEIAEILDFKLHQSNYEKMIDKLYKWKNIVKGANNANWIHYGKE